MAFLGVKRELMNFPKRRVLVVGPSLWVTPLGLFPAGGRSDNTQMNYIFVCRLFTGEARAQQRVRCRQHLCKKAMAAKSIGLGVRRSKNIVQLAVIPEKSVEIQCKEHVISMLRYAIAKDS